MIKLKSVTVLHSYLSEFSIWKHVPHLKLILRSIYSTILHGNVGLIILTATLGSLNRLFALGGMALTFKAIITALAPESTLDAVNLMLLRFNLEIDANMLLFIIASMVFAAYLCSWFCQFLRDRCLKYLIWRVLKHDVYFKYQPALDNDLFLIEGMGPHVQTVTRILEILVFSAIFLAIIAIFAVKLLLMLLPLLIIFVFLIIQYERSRLSRIEQQKKSQSAYINEMDLDGKPKRRDVAANVHERDEYIIAKEALRETAAGSSRNTTLISGAIMLLIIMYVGTLDLEIGEFPFIPLFIVVSIRTLVAYSQQLGRSLTQILELRGKLKYLRDIESINANPMENRDVEK